MTNAVGEGGVPPRRLGTATLTALAGFCLAVLGFVVENMLVIVLDLVVGSSGTRAISGLASFG